MSHLVSWKIIFESVTVMVKYSIIIPHYNCPELLMRCLRSIPVCEEIQVIVVDDCSPNSEQYKELYPDLSRPYLELYSTGTNGGGGKARNVGLRYVKGKWVIFADADDFFVDDFDALLSKYFDNTGDIIFFNVKSCVESDVTTEIKGDVIGNKEKLFRLYRSRGDERIFRYCYTEPWGKMIRFDLIKNNRILFEESIIANDFLFSVKTGHYANGICISEDYLYWHVVMDSSTCRGKRSAEKRIAKIVENVKVQQFLDSKNVKTKINLLSYVNRKKKFFSIMSSDEFRVYKSMRYSLFKVICDRAKLLFNVVSGKITDLDPNTREFI